MMKVSRVALSLAVTIFTIPAIVSSAQAPSPQAPSDRAQRGNRGTWGGGMMGRGVMGTVTEITPDHFTIKSESGDLYTIHYGVNTRFMKGGGGGFRRQQGDDNAPLTPPTPIKPTEIKVGDAIGAAGEMDTTAKTVGAVVVFQIDADTAKRMLEMQANYGKNWLMGRVIAIHEAQVTIQGGPDNATHTFTADENTTFRKRREPITLADIQPGDAVRVEGLLKNGSFLASSVSVMGPRPERPNGAPTPQQ